MSGVKLQEVGVNKHMHAPGEHLVVAFPSPAIMKPSVKTHTPSWRYKHTHIQQVQSDNGCMGFLPVVWLLLWKVDVFHPLCLPEILIFPQALINVNR